MNAGCFLMLHVQLAYAGLTGGSDTSIGHVLPLSASSVGIALLVPHWCHSVLFGFAKSALPVRDVEDSCWQRAYPRGHAACLINILAIVVVVGICC